MTLPITSTSISRALSSILLATDPKIKAVYLLAGWIHGRTQNICHAGCLCHETVKLIKDRALLVSQGTIFRINSHLFKFFGVKSFKLIIRWSILNWFEGSPQCGQASAISDISLPHSGQFIKDIKNGFL
jgi:hypothetical protein